ncbi:MAG: DNA polymerase III subunit delta [Clostridiales Family XIII bacterium]|nr:DNA polymerase III subunit delta [Clostridiales Family XIII bacterium]
MLLSGSEVLLTETYERRLTRRFVAQEGSLLDVARFDAEGTEADDVVAACDTLPMMSEKRVVVLSDFPSDERFHQSPKAAKLAEYLPFIPETALLIFTAATFPKRFALFKSILANGCVYEFARLSEDELRAFIKGRFKTEKTQASDEVVEAVARASGYFERESPVDLCAVEGDVKRVAAHASANANREVALSDVAACMDATDETHVFALLDAVSSGRKGEALELLENIVSKGEATYRLLALLTGQFEIMLGCKEMQDRSYSFAETAKALGVKSEFRLKKAARFAAAYSSNDLMRLLDRLYRVDRDIKSGLYSDKLALTMFVAEM